MNVTALQTLRQPPQAYLLKPLVIFFLLIAGCVAAARVSGLAAQAGVVAFLATNVLALFSVMHDAGHGHLARNPRLNDAAGVIIGILLGTSFHAYRICHREHHLHLRQDADTQDVIHATRKRSVLALLLLIAATAGGAIFIWIRVPLAGLRLAPRKSTVIVETLGGIAFLALLFGVMLAPTARAQLAAGIVIAIVWGSMIDITYHQGLSDSGATESSRSFDCDRFGALLLAGQNRHAEHHAFPWIPGPHLAAASKLAREELEAKGAVYSPSFVRTLLHELFVRPLFLPPQRDSGPPLTHGDREIRHT